jgi:Mn2+/Fe2+ NRAMP family transporter
VLVILLFYKPDGSMGAIRAFEWFVAAIVLGVVICFSVELSLIQNSRVGEVFRGYLPSAAVIKSNGYTPSIDSYAVVLIDCTGCILVAVSLVRL